MLAMPQLLSTRASASPPVRRRRSGVASAVSFWLASIFITSCRLEGVVPLMRLDGDPAQHGEFGDPGRPAEAAVAGVLGAAERHLRLVLHCGTVNVANAGVDASRNRQGAGDVPAEYRCREAKFGVVGDPDGVV